MNISLKIDQFALYREPNFRDIPGFLYVLICQYWIGTKADLIKLLNGIQPAIEFSVDDECETGNNIMTITEHEEHIALRQQGKLGSVFEQMKNSDNGFQRRRTGI